MSSFVTKTGCAGIRAHGGDAATLRQGNLQITGNTISHFALWKRTYEAGIHWAGVYNNYSNNTVLGMLISIFVKINMFFGLCLFDFCF